jgi:uncharacterized membrane protein YobD (UPF0266 family)
MLLITFLIVLRSAVFQTTHKISGILFTAVSLSFVYIFYISFPLVPNWNTGPFWGFLILFGHLVGVISPSQRPLRTRNTERQGQTSVL